MMIKMISHSLKNHNEDSCFADETLAFVIDGASGLDNINISDIESDASWYANRIKENILKFRMLDDLKEVLNYALIQTNKEYRDFDGIKSICDFPSAVISIVRVKDTLIEYLVLGDCVCLIQNFEGQIMCITDHRVDSFDERAIQKGMEIAKSLQIDFCDTRPFYIDILRENRKLKNKNNGYYALSDKVDIDACIGGSLDRKNIDKIMLMSDGFHQIVNVFHLYNQSELFEIAQSNELDFLMRALFDEQSKDCKMNKYPRLSKFDDATLIFLNMNE